MIDQDRLASSHPFDSAALTYDQDFTGRRLGQWLRGEVWRWLGKTFRAGDNILELGCGTGEDALWMARRGIRVTATDGSSEMLAAAKRKAEVALVGDRLDFRQLDLAGDALHLAGSARRDGSPTPRQWDGAFSNFGALNCQAERSTLARALASWVRPGGYVVLVLMGPLCPWEMGWHLLHGKPGAAFRRFRKGRAAHVGGGATVRVWYPSPWRLRREFAPAFRHVKTVGIGSLLPPSYLAHLVDRWPGLFGKAAWLDGRLGPYFPWNWLNDHYLMVLQRSGEWRGSNE